VGARRLPFRVARETLSNLTDVLAQATPPEDLIRRGSGEQLTSTWAWVKIQFPVLGYRATPYEQMTASVVLSRSCWSSSRSAFLTWVAPIFIFPFLFGAARLIPPVDRAWPLTASRGDRPV